MKIPAYVLGVGLCIWCFIRLLNLAGWEFVLIQYLIGFGAQLAVALGKAAKS